jgi:hypothetical protein
MSYISYYIIDQEILMKKFLFVFGMLMASVAGIACADATKVHAELTEARQDPKATKDTLKAIIEAAVARGDINLTEAEALIAEFCAQ